MSRNHNAFSDEEISDFSYTPDDDVDHDESVVNSDDDNEPIEYGDDGNSQETVAASDEDEFTTAPSGEDAPSSSFQGTGERVAPLTSVTASESFGSNRHRSRRIIDEDDDDGDDESIPVATNMPVSEHLENESDDDDIIVIGRQRAYAVLRSSSDGSSSRSSSSDEHVVSRPTKRRRTEEQPEPTIADHPKPQPSTSNVAVNGDVDDEDEEFGCTICYEDFTNAGDHRLVSLKCGHFYGRNCIERWIRSEGRAASCPTCKGRANLRDLRNHFSKTIKQTDTSELESLKVSNAEYTRRVAELELSSARKDAEIKKLRKELLEFNMPRTINLPTSDVRAGKIEFQAGCRIHLSTDASYHPQARAFDFNGKSFAIGVATSSNVTLFNKYAIRMGSWENGKMFFGASLPIHANRPRFVVFSPWEQDLVLSGGEDKRAVVHTLGSRSVRNDWNVPGGRQIWTGCWTSPSTIVVGSNDGRIWEYDMDSSSTEPTRDLTNGVGHVPVVFLASDISTGTILVGTFKKVFAVHGNTVYPLLTSIEDRFDKIRSISFDNQRMVFAVSFGPGGRHPAMSHRLYKLDVNSEDANTSVGCVELACWNTSCMMNSTLWSNSLFSIGENLLSVVFNEDKKMLDIHDWSGKRNDVSVKFSSVGNATMMNVAPSNSSERTVFVLTEKSMSAFTVHISN